MDTLHNAPADADGLGRTREASDEPPHASPRPGPKPGSDWRARPATARYAVRSPAVSRRRSAVDGDDRASAGSWLEMVTALTPRLPAVVGGICVAIFVVQAALGWGLGVAGAGLTVLVAVSILGALVVADALDVTQTQPSDDAYDVVVCAGATIAVALAVACLYLPSPWGGLCSAVVVAVLVAALRLRSRRAG